MREASGGWKSYSIEVHMRYSDAPMPRGELPPPEDHTDAGLLSLPHGNLRPSLYPGGLSVGLFTVGVLHWFRQQVTAGGVLF